MVCSPLLRRLAFAGLTLTAAPLFAADFTSTWSGTTDLWTNPASWITPGAPGTFPNNGVSTYDAIINAVAPLYTVALNTSITVEDLALSSANATINHTAGTFTATGAIGISAGTYQLNGGTISNTVINQSGTGSLLISASSSNLLNAVTVNGDLNLNVNLAHTQIAGGTTFNTAHLAEQATSLGFAPGQTLTGTILFEGAVGSFRVVEMNGTAGTFTVGAPGVIRTEAGLGGDGQIGGGLHYYGAMTLINQGLISSQTSGRKLTVQPASLTNTGTLAASSGGILTIAPTGTWTNAGTISVNNAVVNLGGTFDATGGIGTFINTNGTVNITGTINNAGSAFSLNNTTGSWMLAGGTISGGMLAFADGQNLLISASSSNLLNAVTVNGDLNLNVNLAHTQIAGGTTFNTAHLAEQATSLGFAPGQTLTGTILFEGAVGSFRVVEMNGTAGTFTVGAPGVIRTEAGLGGDGQIGGGLHYYGAMTLINQGLISSQTSGRKLTVQPASLTNTGTLAASSGGILTIAPTGTWTNAGTISVNNAVVNLGGTFDATGGIGTFINTNGTVNITGTINNAGSAFSLNNTTGSWMLAGGTISGGEITPGAGGETLLFTSDSGILSNGARFNGNLDLSAASATVRLQSGAGFAGVANLSGPNTRLVIEDTQTLTGKTVNLDGSNVVLGIDGTNSLTFGAGTLVRGRGSVGMAQFVGGTNILLNQGTIRADLAGQTLLINPKAFTNQVGGVVEAISGGLLTVSLSTAITNYDIATQTLTGGAWVASSAAPDSILQLNRTGDIVVNAADITLSGAGSVFRAGTTTTTLDSTLTTNSGALSILAGRNYTAPSAFTSSGILQLGGGIFTAPMLTNSGSGHILGFGTISGPLDSSGRVTAQGGTLQISGTVAQYAGNSLMGGTWVVMDGATLLIPTPAGEIQTNNADVTLSGTTSVFARINALTTNNGAFRLLANRSFTAAGAFTNTGVLQMGGGTFTTTSLTNSATSELFGFGSIAVRPANSGKVRAAGGTLTLSNGIQGTGGTVQIDAGAVLSLKGGTSGSNADFLVHDGTTAGSLNLGANNFTVGVDYTNGSDSGNSFNPRANVSGAGQILATGGIAQQLVGNVTGGTGATPGMAFGNIHVGASATRYYQINSVGASGSSLRGAIQTSVNGGNVTDARLSGTGVTAANFGPIAPGGNTGDRAVTFTATSAGTLTGQTVRLLNNFDNVSDQLLAISGAAFRFASPVHTPEPVNFGNLHLGAPAPAQAVSVFNSAANDSFSEALDAVIGSPTGGVTTNAGAFSLLAPGSTNSSAFVVGIKMASTGSKNGTATITLTSNGSGSSALGTTALAAQTVNVTGFVYSGLGVWNVNASNAWNATGNWQALGGVPGLDAGFTTTDTATFGSAATSVNPTVSLNGVSPSLEAITFDNALQSYTLAPGTGSGLLKLDNGGSAASVTASSGSHTISAPLELHSDLTVTVAGGSTLAVSGGISGTGGPKALTKTGAGTLVLSGTQTYATLTTSTGSTDVNSALGTGTSTVNANAATTFHASQTLAALSIGAGGVVTLTEGGAGFAGEAAGSFDEIIPLDREFGQQDDVLFSLDAAVAKSAAQAVPEPGSLGLLILGVMTMWRRRKRLEAV